MMAMGAKVKSKNVQPVKSKMAPPMKAVAKAKAKSPLRLAVAKAKAKSPRKAAKAKAMAIEKPIPWTDPAGWRRALRVAKAKAKARAKAKATPTPSPLLPFTVDPDKWNVNIVGQPSVMKLEEPGALKYITTVDPVPEDS